MRILSATEPTLQLRKDLNLLRITEADQGRTCPQPVASLQHYCEANAMCLVGKHHLDTKLAGASGRLQINDFARCPLWAD